MAESNYQMLEFLSFCDRERNYPASIKITCVNSCGEKECNEAIPDVFFCFFFFLEYARKMQGKSRPRILESKVSNNNPMEQFDPASTESHSAHAISKRLGGVRDLRFG